MAISRMQKINIMATRDQLDPVMSRVQQLKKVQVIDLSADNHEDHAKALVSYYDHYQDQNVLDQQALSRIQGRLTTINYMIKQLDKYVTKPSLIQQLRTEKPAYTYQDLVQHDQEFPEREIVEKTQTMLDRMKTIDELSEKRQQQIDRYSKWKNLDLVPQALVNFQRIKARIGTVPNVESNIHINALKQSEPLDVSIIYLNDNEYGVVVFYQPSDQDQVDQLLSQAQFSLFDYPYRTLPKDKILVWQKEKDDLKLERQSIVESMRQAKDQLEGLKVQADWVQSTLDLAINKQKLGVTKHLMAIQGWIEAEQVTGLKQDLHDVFGDQLSIETLEVEESDIDDVPIKLKNNGLVAPFELITKMYALPKYNEIDPTPFLMPFYFVFFGMMVADLGYGLLTVLLSLVGLKAFKLGDSAKSTLRFGVILGVAISIWGFLYGSFFGLTLPIQLINPNQDVMLILGLSVFFGLIHIFTALGLNIYLKVKEKNWVEAYSGGLAWIFLLLGFILLGLATLSPNYGILGQIGKWLSILNALGIVIASCVKAGGLGGLGWGLYDLYGVTGYIGDLVSYTRLMALGLSGGSIALAFNMIIQFLPGPARFTVGILLFVLLHALSIFLSFLSAYVHGARLIFVEFFAKFYSGGGKPFEPLKLSDQHIQVKD